MARRRRDLYRGYNVLVNGKITSPDDPRVFFVVCVFNCGQCNAEWESPLIGNENGQDCEQCHQVILPSSIIRDGRTPIQDASGKFFGNFKCHQCSRTWCSAHTWANTPQKCRQCEIDIYPFAMTPLRRGLQVGDPNSGHETGLCRKCRELGKNCSKLRSGGRRRIRGRQGRRRTVNPAAAVNQLVGQMQNLAV